VILGARSEDVTLLANKEISRVNKEDVVVFWGGAKMKQTLD
jgi:hypothetical protein